MDLRRLAQRIGPALRPASLLPLYLTLAPLPLVVTGLWVSVHTTLGRDQGIFQYIAFALSRGDRDYVDVRDVNGPFIHTVHRVFLALGGGDELVFHTLDRVVTLACFFALGAALPSLADAPEGASTGRSPARRLLFGAAMTVVGAAQYLRYLSWDLAQRENFCGWLACLAAAALFVGLDPARPLATRSNAALVALAGLFGAVAVFGKHTFAPFLATNGLTALLVGFPTAGRGRVRGSPLARRLRAALVFSAGAALGVLVMLAVLAVQGDVRAFARLWFVDAPQMYVYIWPHTPRELYELDWNRVPFQLAAAGTAVGLVALATRLLPLRALPMVLWSALGVLGVLLQKKGFPYHLHPVSLGTSALALTLLHALAARATDLPEERRRPRILYGAAAALGVALFTHWVRFTVAGGPHVLFPWPATVGATAAQRGVPFPLDDVSVARPWLDAFRGWDYFPREMRAAGAFLNAHTPEGARVQIYGMDPYVLFFARRLSATPYIYAYDLDADAAWHGALDTAPAGREEAAAAVVKQMERDHWRDLHARLDSHPAAAWVLFDRAPLTSAEDALQDLADHDPPMAETLRRDYEEAYAFGAVRVFLRRAR